MDLQRTPGDALCSFRQTHPVAGTGPLAFVESNKVGIDVGRAHDWYPQRSLDGNQAYQLSSIRQLPMELHLQFFSMENLRNIEAELTKRVKEETTYVIDRQSQQAIEIIMRYVFDEHARYLPDDVPGQVKVLNEKVLEQLVPMVVTNLKRYLEYLRDVTTLPMPLDRAVNTSVVGTNPTSLSPTMF